MNSSRFANRATISTAAVLAVCLLPTCSQDPRVGTTPNSGGAGGKGGQSSVNGGAGGNGGEGGSGESDASVISIRLDVIPAWWGESDAMHEPDLPPVPTEDANCGMLTQETTRQPVDVLLVLDRSSSMDWSLDQDCYCTATAGSPGATLCTNTTNCTSRWNAIKPAVTTTLSTSSYVNWGLKFFGSAELSTCGVSKTMEVEIGKDSAAKVQSQVDSAKLSLGTPTAAAINAATAYLKTVQDSNKKFILVATDGEPNCGGNPANINTDDVTGASSAAAAANTAGFPVYVVGIGPTVANLTQLAVSGGTKDFYPVSSPQQLVDALSAISKKVGSCSYQSDKEPPDSNNIAVYVNKQQVAKDPNNGWTFGATTKEIKLTGSYCDDITAGKDTAVQILYGCEGAPPFPPFVP